MPETDETNSVVESQTNDLRDRMAATPTAINITEVNEPEAVAPVAQAVPVVPVESLAPVAPAEPVVESMPVGMPTITPVTMPEMPTLEAPAAPAAIEAPAMPSVAESAPVAPSATPTRTPAEAAALGAKVVVGSLMTLLVISAWGLHANNNKLAANLSALRANPQTAVQQQSDSLITQVGSLMTLPTGETPTVAAVSDIAAAKQQSAFFNNAQNGDRVLMYVKAGEAILYRPSTNKVVLVAPLTFNNTTSGTAKQ